MSDASDGWEPSSSRKDVSGFRLAVFESENDDGEGGWSWCILQGEDGPIAAGEEPSTDAAMRAAEESVARLAGVPS